MTHTSVDPVININCLSCVKSKLVGCGSDNLFCKYKEDTFHPWSNEAHNPCENWTPSKTDIRNYILKFKLKKEGKL